jgi:hypothetical protein
MGQVIGNLLPFAVGVAVSPIPIIATILMLFAPHAEATSVAFLGGWIIGIAAAATVFIAIAGATDLGTNQQPSAIGGWIRLLLGLILLVLAVKNWRRRPKPGQSPHLPRWLTAIDTITPIRAVGLGFLLSAVNPKNLTLCAASGAAIGAGHLDGTAVFVSAAVFTVIAASTVALPVIAYAIAPRPMHTILDHLKTWLEANNTAVMAVLLLVIGVVLIGHAISAIS